MRTRSVAFLQITTFLLLSALLGASPQAKPPSELSLILERHRAAVGGIVALEAVQSYREEGTYYSSGTAARWGFTLFRTRSGLLRIDSHPAKGFTCVLDAFDRALRWATCGNEGFVSHPITPSEHKRRQATFDGPLARPSSAITLLGHEEIDGRDAIHLQVAKTTAALSEDYFLDPETYLTIRIDSGAAGERTVVRLGDYRRVGAIVYRFRRDETAPDGTVFTRIVDRVALNNTEETSYFTPTAADRGVLPARAQSVGAPVVPSAPSQSRRDAATRKDVGAEASALWVEIRNDPKAYEGRVVTWRMKFQGWRVIDSRFTEVPDAMCDLNGDSRRPVRLLPWKQNGNGFWQRFSNMADGDWILVTGEVITKGNSRASSVLLEPSNIVNEGFRD